MAMAARVLRIKVKPNARESSLSQSIDGTWQAKLKSPPVDGKANAELITLIATQFQCTKSAVSIKAGATARIKTVIIAT